jgi:hypothetical protein
VLNGNDVPANVHIAVVGCFPKSAKDSVNNLFPGTWLNFPGQLPGDKLTKLYQDAPAALNAFVTAQKNNPNNTIRVYCDPSFKNAIQAMYDSVNAKPGPRPAKAAAKWKGLLDACNAQ